MSFGVSEWWWVVVMVVVMVVVVVVFGTGPSNRWTNLMAWDMSSPKTGRQYRHGSRDVPAKAFAACRRQIAADSSVRTCVG